jgi:hypothetical protein
MSNDVDMLLRDTLRDRAQAAPAGAGLLRQVRTRSRLLRCRRRAGVAGAGVAAVVLAAGTAPLLSNLTNAGGPGVVPGASATGPAGGTARTPSASPTGPAPALAAVLAPATVTLPVFPFEPGSDAVPGLGPARAMVFAGNVYLSHPSTGSDGPSLDVHLGVDPAPDPTGQDGISVQNTTVRVRGVEGTLRTVTKETYTSRTLSWGDAGGAGGSGAMWIRADGVAPDRMIAYADALRPGTVEITAPFTFDLLPQGLVLDDIGPTDMVFRLAGQPAGEDWTHKLAVLLNADGGAEAATWPLRVGGRPAQIVPQDGGRSLMVLQESGNILVVQVPTNLTISDGDLLRLAAGIRVTAAAKAGRG